LALVGVGDGRDDCQPEAVPVADASPATAPKRLREVAYLLGGHNRAAVGDDEQGALGLDRGADLQPAGFAVVLDGVSERFAGISARSTASRARSSGRTSLRCDMGTSCSDLH
jgi:hypothetical protein